MSGLRPREDPAVGGALPAAELIESAGQPLTTSEIPLPALLIFYPRDGTSGCTLELTEFSRMKARFEEKGVFLLGVSCDPPESHAEFTAQCGIEISLATDPDAALARTLTIWRRMPSEFRHGVWEETDGERAYFGIERTTVFVDAAGRIEWILRDVDPAGHAAAVFDLIHGR